MHKPFIDGKDIYLRELEAEDINENYQQWFNDSEVCRFNSHHRFPNYRQNMQDYYDHVIKSKNNLILAIVDKQTDKHIGNISLQDIDQINRSAELAIIIGDKNYWGRGVGKEAVNLIVRHGFKSINLNRIYCGTADNNVGMQKIAEACGFKKEGAARGALFKDGHYHDMINYGLLAVEYEG